MAIGLIINHIFTKYYKITVQNYITIQRDKADLLFRKATKLLIRQILWIPTFKVVGSENRWGVGKKINVKLWSQTKAINVICC